MSVHRHNLKILGVHIVPSVLLLTNPNPSTLLQLAASRIHTVRTRGGNIKFRALRLDTGNFSWASEGTARKTRIIDVVYNASNNELVRTKTLVKNAIVVIDATPFRQWYESHYILPLGRRKDKKDAIDENDVLNKKRSAATMKKYVARQKLAKVEHGLEEQFSSGRLLGKHPIRITFPSVEGSVRDVKPKAIYQSHGGTCFVLRPSSGRE